MAWMLYRIYLLIIIFSTSVFAEENKDSIQYFMKIHEVAKSPRCLNCHSPANYPMQTDLGIPHVMNITRNIDKLGLRCTTCHSATGESNLYNPPTAANWKMPSKEKALYKNMSPQYLCQLWKNPQHNAFESGERAGQSRSLQEILEHLTEDPLVQWAWKPGSLRAPAPGTHAEFIENVDNWIKTGALCP